MLDMVRLDMKGWLFGDLMCRMSFCIDRVLVGRLYGQMKNELCRLDDFICCVRDEGLLCWLASGSVVEQREDLWRDGSAIE